MPDENVHYFDPEYGPLTDLWDAVHNPTASSEQPELLPCPFCGGKAVLTNVRMSDYMFKVGCYNELCWRPGTDYFTSEADAIAAWNRRVPSSGQPEPETGERIEGWAWDLHRLRPGFAKGDSPIPDYATLGAVRATLLVHGMASVPTASAGADSGNSDTRSGSGETPPGAAAQPHSPARASTSTEQPKPHWLKTDGAMFNEVVLGHKTFDIRFDDRGYREGDLLVLRETRSTGEEMRAGAPLDYTGRDCARIVTHILRGPIYGLKEGWVIMSIASPSVETK
jgi:hypothetical protein